MRRSSRLRRVAAAGGATPAAWWVVILTIGPVLGSFITEPAAMTICALLLARQFFDLQPSTRLKYATLAKSPLRCSMPFNELPSTAVTGTTRS